ncbi:hypothetical protein IMG5_174570 [Ichthyophthirius multifiliis]|uniref:Transmembrane protein n=1 Tax=Ichthyophthirius multifiliis TaxID=5932 RepID=G0R230_ICHMU|nr:hypothetical protein IMG5_174570 [Ichthyophthirius multifiliis]EGR28472.1 hypothetical protein IMG5_174570 [Ichthyophthirius multifiliis]|eukprot:XP_004029708.1 hypothetical protein IMG5_174570 [Ichthyophthirius multifiliis]
MLRIHIQDKQILYIYHYQDNFYLIKNIIQKMKFIKILSNQLLYRIIMMQIMELQMNYIWMKMKISNTKIYKKTTGQGINIKVMFQIIILNFFQVIQMIIELDKQPLMKQIRKFQDLKMKNKIEKVMLKTQNIKFMFWNKKSLIKELLKNK